MPLHFLPQMYSRSIRSWASCLVVGMVFFFEYFQINMFNVLDKPLLQEFNIHISTLSLLSSVYFYGMVLLLLPAGLVLDHFSIRKVISIAMTIAILGTIAFAQGKSIQQLLLSRLIVGLSIGPVALVGAIKLISRWMLQKDMFLAVSIIISMGMLAGILSQAPFAFLVNELGWRMAVFLDSAMGLLILGLVLLFIKDYPLTSNNNIPKFNYKSLFVIKNVIKRKTNWYLGIFTSVLNMPLFLLGSMVGSLYLEHVYRYNIVDGANITGMLYVGMLMGCPIFGYIAGVSRSKLQIIGAGAFIYLVAVLLLIFFHLPSKLYLYLIFFFIGFGVSSQNISFSLIERFNHKDEVGIAEALHSILIMLGAAIFQPLLGFVLNFYWEGNFESSTQIFSSKAYDKAFLLMPISIVLTMPLLFITNVALKTNRNLK